jgi:two-component system, NarL family, sensor histidine kinase UhpB
MISLKIGLNWLVGLILVVTLMINLGIQLTHAGPRVRAEAGSNLRLAREFVLKSITNIPDQENPIPRLQSLFANLGSLRHVDIRILGSTESSQGVWVGLEHNHDVPGWFVKLVGASPRAITVPLQIDGRDYGKVLITSNPFDELQEIWSDMTWLASISMAVALAILVLVLILMQIALSPLEALQAGLSDLEAGKWGVRLTPRGAIEFRKIAAALNSLSGSLDKVRIDNRQLVTELIEVQDSERRDVARDLHDEAGPCLFSLRAAALQLQEAVTQSVTDRSRVADLASVIDRSSESLQHLIRGLLGRLRPPGLDELGLEAALKTLFANWARSHPDVSIKLNVPHDLSSLEGESASVAYRVVQEGVTNIFRHSRASEASISVAFALEDGVEKFDQDPEGVPQLQILIEDNGVGFQGRPNPGMGLVGMRERVHKLGGAFVISKRASGGARIYASIPIAEEGGEW